MLVRAHGMRRLLLVIPTLLGTAPAGCGLLSPYIQWETTRPPFDHVEFLGSGEQRVVLHRELEQRSTADRAFWILCATIWAFVPVDPIALYTRSWASIALQTPPPISAVHHLDTPYGWVSLAADADWVVWSDRSSDSPLRVINLSNGQETQVNLETDRLGIVTLTSVNLNRVLAIHDSSYETGDSVYLIDLPGGTTQRIDGVGGDADGYLASAALSDDLAAVAVTGINGISSPTGFLAPYRGFRITLVDLTNEQRTTIASEVEAELHGGPWIVDDRVVWLYGDTGVFQSTVGRNRIRSYDIASAESTDLLVQPTSQDGKTVWVNVLDVDSAGVLLVVTRVDSAQIDAWSIIAGPSPLLMQSQRSIQLLRWDGSVQVLRSFQGPAVGLVDSRTGIALAGALVGERAIVRDSATGAVLIISPADGATERIEVFPE